MSDAPSAGNWQTAFALKTDLRQRDMYAFEEALRLLEQGKPTVDTLIARTFQILRNLGMTVNSSIEADHHLKAAIKAGWLVSPEAETAEISGRRARLVYLLGGEDVDDLHPGKVIWYGARIIEAYNKAKEPPDPNS